MGGRKLPGYTVPMYFTVYIIHNVTTLNTLFESVELSQMLTANAAMEAMFGRRNTSD